jgi:hypothetical protein
MPARVDAQEDCSAPRAEWPFLARSGKLFRRNGCRLTHFSRRLADDDYRTLQCESSHDRGYDNIWPSTIGAEYTKRGEQHGKIAEHIISGTNPR